jgi:hypothetical protein
MSQDTPIVLIIPDAQATLEDEAGRGGIGGELTGGLLFGYAPDARHRLVVSSTRLKAEAGFGQRNFSLDQTRTSRQLDHARSLNPQATYCGVWYVHRTPNFKLSDEEWTQARNLLEDPDYRLQDLVCLVLCFYSGALKIHALSFSRHHAARGQAPAPTQFQLTTERAGAQPTPDTPRPAPSTWFKAPQVAARLSKEHQQLAQKYQVEPAVAPDKELHFRLTPKDKHETLAFYLACGPGFPDKAPHAFVLAGGKPHPLSSPGLSNWSAHKKLVEVADELVEWLAFAPDEYVSEAESALNADDHARAADLLLLVLTIEPRTPRAARLLAQAQAGLEGRGTPP